MAGEGEFDFIARALAPLTRGHRGAYGLKDDGAILAPSTGHDFAVTTDTLVEGVHFPVGEDPFSVGWKALAVNVSDLAAMGAEPKAYFLNVVWPRGGFEARADRFVEGLKAAQDRFGLVLAGGDTTSADAPWTLSITAVGQTPEGRTPRRGAARAGDLLVVSGSIGDAWLGLQIRLAKLEIDDPDARGHFAARFARPCPPVELAAAIGRQASAAIDVSDGLLADIGHILAASGLAASVELGAVPVSRHGQAWIDAQPDAAAARAALATGGDDYEIVAAVPQGNLEPLLQEGARHGRAFTPIGRLAAGQGLTVTFAGEPVELDRLGFTHF